MLFVDLKAEYSYYKEKIEDRINIVLSSGKFLLGPQLEELEASLQTISGKKYAVGVKNCTDAIILVLKYIYRGQTVILPNFGAYPTAVACRNVTDKLFYVDVDDTYTINVDKLPGFKGSIVIAVNLFGNNCDLKRLREYCDVTNSILVEDCAQSTGSGSGVYGDFSVFSFYPTKPLASMGDGGMICTDQEDAHDFFKKMRFYGQTEYGIEMVGLNSRMDEFQCAIVNAKVGGYQELNDRRIEIASKYKTVVRGMKIRGRCVFHQFPVRFEHYDHQSVPFMNHYAHHASDFDCLKGVYNEVSYRISDNIVSIPIHPFLTDIEIEHIMEFLNDNAYAEI